jgi:Ca2+-binding RTX toxin-like protein
MAVPGDITTITGGFVYVCLLVDELRAAAGSQLPCVTNLWCDPGFVDARGDAVDGADGPADVVLAGAGNDTVAAFAGNDTVYGGDDLRPFRPVCCR